ncbi:14730_t:CDS:2, partial [Cetraspora pellucida]
THLHKEVFLATRISESSVTHILSDYNKTGDITLLKHSCQPPKDFQDEYINTIHNLIFSASKSGTPLSIKILILELSKVDLESDEDEDENLDFSDSD